MSSPRCWFGPTNFRRVSALIPLVFLGRQQFAVAQTQAPGIAALAYRPPEPGQLPPTKDQQQNEQKDQQQNQQNIPDALKLPKTISAPPFTLGDKFDYRIVQSFGLRGLGGSLVGAAIGQGSGTPSEWGGGVEGFAKRYASGLAGNLARQTFAFALESSLHEDPRYFPADAESTKIRILNALKQVVVCKTDQGHSSFAYARVVSAFGAGQFVNLWQPNSNDGVGDGFVRGFLTLGGDLAYNMLQEFVPFTRPRSLRHRH
jgi:hypothetical protein